MCVRGGGQSRASSPAPQKAVAAAAMGAEVEDERRALHTSAYVSVRQRTWRKGEELGSADLNLGVLT